MPDETLSARCLRLSEHPGLRGDYADPVAIREALRDAACALAEAEWTPPARDRRPPFFVRVAVWVMMISFSWLLVFCAAGGAAFVVSMLGGDVVTWLLGVPFGLAVAGAVFAVLGVIVTGWERGDAG